MTSDAERQRRHRARKAAARRAAEAERARQLPPDLLALEPEAIAAQILKQLPFEKVDRIVRALNPRLAIQRVGTYTPFNPYIPGGGARNVG